MDKRKSIKYFELDNVESRTKRPKRNGLMLKRRVKSEEGKGREERSREE